MAISVGTLPKYVLTNMASHLPNLFAGAFPGLSSTCNMLKSTSLFQVDHLAFYAIVTLHVADPSLWEPLHKPSHKEFTSKMFCADRCSIFQETDFIRSELQPLYGDNSQIIKRQ